MKGLTKISLLFWQAKRRRDVKNPCDPKSCVYRKPQRPCTYSFDVPLQRVIDHIAGGRKVFTNITNTLSHWLRNSSVIGFGRWAQESLIKIFVYRMCIAVVRFIRIRTLSALNRGTGAQNGQST